MASEPLATATHLTGHRGEVHCLHAPGDDRLFSGGEDGSVRLWDLSAGRAARALLLPSADSAGAVNAVCAGGGAAAMNWVYAAAATHVYGWDLRVPGVVLREPACAFNNLANDEIGHIALHEASGALAVADDAGDVHIVDVGSMAAAPGTTSGAIVPLRGGHTSICTWVAFRPGCNECCSAGLDALCVRWDWRIAAKVEAWPLAALGSPFAVALADALPGSSQSSGGAGSSSEAAAQPSQPSQLLNPRHAHCASYAPDGGCVALALGDGSVEIRLADGGEPICAVDAHRAACSQAHFAAALGPVLAQRAVADAAVDDCSSAAALAARGIPLISAGDDRTVRLWSVEGVAGRASSNRDGKRRRHAANAGSATACDDAMEEEEEEESCDEPGFRSLAAVRLRYKPNAVAAAADPSGSGRAVVCVATTGEAIELLNL